ncbi:uncharacterized protein [Malus domestica]|uniref:uncharacterized protein n=1 Tax=Malus domestica TaxID=3750 RepID=UPI003976782D
MAVSRPDMPPLLELHGQSKVADAPEIAGSDDLGFDWVEREAVLVVDTKIHLEAGNLGETIKEENNASSQDRAKAMIFIYHHLDEGLKSKYLTVKDPLALWNALRNRYNHQKIVILLRARYEWTHLRIQDFKSVAEYNSAMFRISSQMKLCGETITEEDMLENTFNTFHASKVLL